MMLAGGLRVIPWAGLETPCDVVSATPEPADAVALVEQVWASPIMGKSACFTFGANYGAWLATFRAAKIHTLTVTPQRWQRSLCLDTRGPERKRGLLALARKDWPKATLRTADAYLILRYAMQHAAAGTVNRMGEIASL